MANDNKNEIFNVVWSACDTFRGVIDPAQYKDYILTMLFIKYMSDLRKEWKEEAEKKFGGDKERVERALSKQRFIVPDGCDFDSLYGKRNADNLGDIINKALEKIEDENKGKLENVFRNIDFNSEPNLGQTKERNRRLKQLLTDFNHPRLDLRPSKVGNHDIIGDVYEYLIARFASTAGKKAGEFYTPAEVSILLAKLVNPKEGAQVCDPACGSGSLLIRVAEEVGTENFSLAGQELNGSTWALCRMNMFLHGKDASRIEWCDTIRNPKLIKGDSLKKFDIVVANPPFSLDKWGVEEAESDTYSRFHRGVPPKSKGDYAFITHMIEIALEGKGRVGVIVPHGVLFRGGAEGRIRQALIDENVLHAVIGLPAQLFYGTGIPAAILVFDKGRGKNDTDVLFIDASREYDDGKKQNRLRDRDINKIVKTYRDYKTVDKYAYRATLDEIKEAEYNLNIPRYVDTFEEEEEIDIEAVQKEIDDLEKELADTRKEMKKYLKELGFGG